MSDLKNLTPEEQKRLFEELRHDKKFLNTRNAMLAVSVIGGIGLFAAGWMMINNKVTLLDVVTGIAIFVLANTYLVRRLSNMQRTVLERWNREKQAGLRNDKD